VEACISYELILGAVQMEDCLRQRGSSACGRFQELGLDKSGPDIERNHIEIAYFYRVSSFLSNKMSKSF